MPSEDRTYELIIVGGGPAGLTAGLYAGRARIRTLILEREVVGGQAFTTHNIANYPGFPEVVSGPDLIERMEKQAVEVGVDIVGDGVISVELKNRNKVLRTESGHTYEAGALVVSTGVRPRELGVHGERDLRGRGVSYCATCDGPFFRDRHLCVVGGGNSALEEALFLTRFAERVFVIHRRDELRATRILADQARESPKVEFVLDSVVTRIMGESTVTGVVVQNVRTMEERTLDLAGVFVAIGSLPNSGLVGEMVRKTSEGYVVTNERMETLVPGLYAAGDVREKPLRQIVTAAADGAIAAEAAIRYLSSG